jgi:hypothetical protein
MPTKREPGSILSGISGTGQQRGDLSTPGYSFSLRGRVLARCFVVEHLCGKLAGRGPLTEALLKSRAEDLEREETKLRSG